MSALGGAIGGIAGAFSAQGDKERQEAALGKARGNWNYQTHASGQNPTELAKIDPASRDAMMRALTSYEAKANAGGLDAIGRANLSRGIAEGEQAATTSSRQILNQARREGGAQSPAAMIQAQVAGQGGAERARSSALESAALTEAARDTALGGQERAAGAVYGIDANKAAAQDAINRFNVLNAQQNIRNDQAQAAGRTGVDEQEAAMYGGRAGNDIKQFGDIGAGIGGAPGGMLGDIAGGIGGVKNVLGAIRNFGGPATGAGAWGDDVTGAG